MHDTREERGKYRIIWETAGDGSGLLHYALPHHQVKHLLLLFLTLTRATSAGIGVQLGTRFKIPSERSNPNARVASFEPEEGIPGRLSSSSVKLSLSVIMFTRIFGVGLVHRNVDRVVRTSVFEAIFRVKYQFELLMLEAQKLLLHL